MSRCWGASRSSPPIRKKVEAVSRDRKDDYLLGLPVSVGATALVSGDRHLTELETEPAVMTPREFLEVSRS